ncbi:hypothetical protein [Streptomyces sp. NPDC002889]|uniref:hypothetical protein n=1 Tax=Streptomyces sp. NPDC002889 TaxID=3364669 RepID=UPI00368BA38F
MPQHSHAPARVCPSCDGFATARVTLGGRDRHGHLRTITVHCPACHGTGIRLAVRRTHIATTVGVSA